MLGELSGIVNQTLRERIDKSIVETSSKLKLILVWVLLLMGKILKLTDELAQELYKPVIRKFQRRRVIVNGIDEIWAADLIDMQAFSKHNNGIKYTANRIDLFSKFVWIVPLKRKNWTRSRKRIFEDLKRTKT